MLLYLQFPVDLVRLLKKPFMENFIFCAMFEYVLAPIYYPHSPIFP